jgi:hypothetical protein
LLPNLLAHEFSHNFCIACGRVGGDWSIRPALEKQEATVLGAYAVASIGVCNADSLLEFFLKLFHFWMTIRCQNVIPSLFMASSGI